MSTLKDLASILIDARKPKKPPTPITGVELLKRVPDRTLSYTGRHRGQWFKPEYDFQGIQIAQDVDSYLFRAIKKKVDRFMIAGYEFHGSNPETVDYITRRVSEIELATSLPFTLLIQQTVHDLVRYSNAMWVKVRDPEASSGKVRVDLRGIEIDPVAGYFLLPFETLQFKTKPNGEILKIMQVMEINTKEFLPQNLIHFFANRKPGFAVGTPEMLPALDDIALLRRIEENVEELIETNLFPTFHYKIGSDQIPEMITPEGIKESDKVKTTLEYMPTHGIYISDHRHEITAIGSESKALRIDFYLQYFKSRVLSSMGVSAVDVGEGDSANRSTASTISKSLIQDVEALQIQMKLFVEFFVIGELLLEGGYNPLDAEQKVQITFGTIDSEEQTRLENAAIQLWTAQGLTHPEFRKRIGKRAFKEEDFDETFFKRFEEPLELLKSMGPGSAAGTTLAELPQSNVSPEAVKSEEQFTEKQARIAAAAKKVAGKKPASRSSRSASTGSRRASAAKARPSNQHGKRSSPKFSRDISQDLVDRFMEASGHLPQGQELADLVQQFNDEMENLDQVLMERATLTGLSAEAIYSNLLYRAEKLDEQYCERAYIVGQSSPKR